MSAAYTQRAVMSTYSFFFEKGKSDILTSLTYSGHNIQPITAVQWLKEHELLWLKCNGSDALSTSQLLCLLQAVCLCVYKKHTPGKNIIPSYWISPALFSHSWTSCHTVNSAESVSGHCNLLLLQHWHFAMNSITIAAETGKGFPGFFLNFFFFWSLRMT